MSVGTGCYQTQKEVYLIQNQFISTQIFDFEELNF
jgi:hypothetical protein